jgi:hypothetical protein
VDVDGAGGRYVEAVNNEIEHGRYYLISLSQAGASGDAVYKAFAWIIKDNNYEVKLKKIPVYTNIEFFEYLGEEEG